jgi:predicted ferric reductase
MSSELNKNPTDPQSALGLGSLISLLLAASLGAVGALIVLPSWAPALTQTLMGTDPKAYWYLSRGSAFVALGLLWISMILGLLITDKMAKSWPGAPAAFAIHEYVSLLGLVFAAFHALVLLGDHFIRYQVAQILVPFGSINYHPIWVGVGQIGFYVWAIISATFYVRQLIGPKAWRLIHFASFFNFAVAMIHGLGAGTDHATAWAQAIYWIMGATTFFLTVYRVAASVAGPERRPVPQIAPTPRPPGSEPSGNSI